MVNTKKVFYLRGAWRLSQGHLLANEVWRSTCLSSPSFTSTFSLSLSSHSSSSVPPSGFPPCWHPVPKSHHWTEVREVSVHKGLMFSSLLLQGTEVWHPVHPTAQPAEPAEEHNILEMYFWSPGRCLHIYLGSLAGLDHLVWRESVLPHLHCSQGSASGRVAAWLQCWYKQNHLWSSPVLA